MFGVELAERWIALNPLSDEAHRHLMRLYMRSGQKHLALRQYEKCRQHLSDELGTPPTQTTQTLYQTIQEQSFPPPAQLPTYLTPFIGRKN